MSQEVFTSIYLDKRRKKSGNVYPVKLSVYHSKFKKKKLYPTVFNLTEQDFASSYLSDSPRRKNKELKEELEALKAKAQGVIGKLEAFTFDQFEKKMFRKPKQGISVSYHYEITISELEKRNQVSTADLYKLARNSFSLFLKTYAKGKIEGLTFYDITVDWLKDYEGFMLDEKERSINTLSIYLRTLRTIFNNAISDGDIEKEYYPFGKRKYQVPSKVNKKKALTNDQLKAVFNAEPKTVDQEKAKEFWFFIYLCNGINVKDIAKLKFSDLDLKDEKFTFYRAKTSLTSKEKLTPIVVYLNEYSLNVVHKYKRRSKDNSDYVFQIIDKGLDAKSEQKLIKNFTRYINQHMKKLVHQFNADLIASKEENEDLPPNEKDLLPEISTYWARHSFATTAVRKGASMEFVQESLGHKNIKTTQNYFAGFDDESKKEFAKSMLNF